MPSDTLWLLWPVLSEQTDRFSCFSIGGNSDRDISVVSGNDNLDSELFPNLCDLSVSELSEGPGVSFEGIAPATAAAAGVTHSDSNGSNLP